WRGGDGDGGGVRGEEWAVGGQGQGNRGGGGAQGGAGDHGIPAVRRLSTACSTRRPECHVAYCSPTSRRSDVRPGRTPISQVMPSGASPSACTRPACTPRR